MVSALTVDSKTRLISLCATYSTIVDASDYEELSKYNWKPCYNGKYVYVRRSPWMLMHRQLLTAVKEEIVDHINGNGLDNRRCNLRIASASTNGINRHRTNSNNTSGIKGVSFNKSGNSWRAQIGLDGKNIDLGCFKTWKEAALVRQVAEARLHEKRLRAAHMLPIGRDR